jgi:hypothetical protein
MIAHMLPVFDVLILDSESQPELQQQQTGSAQV